MNDLTIQVLVATMNQKESDYSLLEKMNIQSDAIVCNQCDSYSYRKFVWNGYNISWFNFNERGVGLNRNNALMRASADVVVFCDDDMVLVDGYKDIIIKGFVDYAYADVLIFNISGRTQNKSVTRVNRFNYLRYGAARIACKLKSVKSNGILFNLCFGGGTEHQHGEDNIFLCNCLDKGLKIYTFPYLIAELTNERNSTWRKEFDKKYFQDQGALYRQISRYNWRLLCLIDSIKHRRRYACNWFAAYKSMISFEEQEIA